MLAGPRLRCSLRDERNSSVFLIGEASLATERAAALQAAQSSSWCEDIAAAMHRAWSCDASVSARGALGQAVGAAPVAGMSFHGLVHPAVYAWGTHLSPSFEPNRAVSSEEGKGNSRGKGYSWGHTVGT